MSDARHLLKTTRNCLQNFGYGKYIWCIWKGVMYILWNHIANIFDEIFEGGCPLLPKIIYEHIDILFNFKYKTGWLSFKFYS